MTPGNFFQCHFFFSLTDRNVGKKPIYQSPKTKLLKVNFLFFDLCIFDGREKEGMGDKMKMLGSRCRGQMKVGSKVDRGYLP